MVGLGSYLALVSLCVTWLALRKKDRRAALAAQGAELWPLPWGCGNRGRLAVTEVGRQPWIIQGIMRTVDAVTPMPGLVVPLSPSPCST